ncbi:hypothetical protein B0H13DRAFT_2293214 [Mycena leptocephala]|nr:hypothetical protein B0H13DRAFT_2293214 [Mycena leptocephala]
MRRTPSRVVRDRAGSKELQTSTRADLGVRLWEWGLGLGLCGKMRARARRWGAGEEGDGNRQGKRKRTFTTGARTAPRRAQSGKSPCEADERRALASPLPPHAPGDARSPMGEVGGRMGISDAGPQNVQGGESGRARSRRRRGRRQERTGEEGKRRTRAGVRRSKGRKAERAPTAGTDMGGAGSSTASVSGGGARGGRVGPSWYNASASRANGWVRGIGGEPDERGPKMKMGRREREGQMKGSACVGRTYEDHVEDVAAGALGTRGRGGEGAGGFCFVGSHTRHGHPPLIPQLSGYPRR